MNHDSNEFLIAGNWKMNGNRTLEVFFRTAFDKHINGVNVLVCPPFTLLGIANVWRIFTRCSERKRGQ